MSYNYGNTSSRTRFSGRLLFALLCGLVLLLGYLTTLFPASRYTPIANSHLSGHPGVGHTYLPSGLLTLNPSGPHPISELIHAAESNWDKKLKNASRTLDEAVKEYQRRYGRGPPVGFDLWWDYVQRHNVQLPDEYDQIHLDLEPYWGISPPDLNALITELTSHPDTYTLLKSPSSPLQINGTSLPDHSRRQHLELAGKLVGLLREVEGELPAFRAVFSVRDNPRFLNDEALRAAAVEAAARGTYLDLKNLPPTQSAGWLFACNASTPARNTPFDLTNPPPPQSIKTFIHTHPPTMSPCLHPSLLHLVGQFLSHGSGPPPERSFFPIFSYSSTTMHRDIRVTAPHSWVDGEEGGKAWEERVDERMLWRGRNTGMWDGARTPWLSSQRVRLLDFAHDLNGSVLVLPSPQNSNSNSPTPVGEGVEVRKALLKPGMLDVAFVGKPIGCERVVCEEMEGRWEWRGVMGPEREGGYRFVFDIDGNGWSSRFKRLMSSNAMVLKATVYPEWFTDRLVPWVHYVPVQMDLSDLHDILVFFRGGLDGAGAHEAMAEKIAREGRAWSGSFWRRVDMGAYMFRLMLEYARVTSLDREAMTYVS